MLVHTKKMKKSPLEKFIAKLKILTNKKKKTTNKKKSKPKPKPCNCGCGGGN